MKRIFAILLAAVLVMGCFMSLCSCDMATTPAGGNNTNTPVDTSVDTSGDIPSAPPADILVPSDVKNAIVINYTKNGNGTVTAPSTADCNSNFIYKHRITSLVK